MATTDMPCCEAMFWVYLVISAAIVAFAGLMSGLTLGLMSLSLVDLEVLAKAGQPHERKNAEKILPIVKNQHLLLCTLLIGNSLAMEALPIFLDSLVPAWGAVLISVTLILAFGEIIPQAVCSRHGLSVGAKLSGIVRLLVLLLYPISYPISKLLDWILGKRHSALLRRGELKTLVDMHGNEAGKGGELTHDETTIIAGALDMTQKTAKDAMTPIAEIFSLDINSKLDEETTTLILSKGHSRIPIYSGCPTNVAGLILVKNLIKCRPEEETPIRNLDIRRIPRVCDCLPLYDILNQFQKGHSHMAAVVRCKKDVKETPENTNDKPSTIEIYINSNTKQEQAEKKDIKIHVDKNEQRNVSRMVSSVTSSDNEIQSPRFKNVMEHGTERCRQLTIWEQGDEYILIEELQYLSDVDEEVIGVITMEDVMEELLQEEIWDETDAYVNAQNKIKIIMHTPRRSSPRSARASSASHLSPRSARASSASHLHWRTPEASPLSSYHHTPLSSCSHTCIVHSPISPYILSPLVRPTLYASPGQSIPSSAAGFIGIGHCSPLSHRDSRKSYEKLRQPGGS